MLAAQRQIEASRPRIQSETLQDRSSSGSSTIKRPAAARRAVTVHSDRQPAFLSDKGGARKASAQTTATVTTDGPGTSNRTRTDTRGRSGGEARASNDARSRPLTTVYDQAIQRVQEWNEALQGEPETIERVQYHLT